MRSPRFRAVVASLLIVVMVSPAARAAEVPTNLDLMEDLTSQIVEELLSKLPPHVSGDQVVLSPYGAGERYHFLENQFSYVLSTKGYRVSTSSVPDSVAARQMRQVQRGGAQDTESRGYRLSFQAIDFRLQYAKTYRAYLIGGKRVKRTADLKILGKVIDQSDGTIIWMGEAARSHSDNFSFNDIEEIEAGTYTFTKPSRSETNWGKVVEPVVVTGIIVGLIYLFFSNQNSD